MQVSGNFLAQDSRACVTVSPLLSWISQMCLA